MNNEDFVSKEICQLKHKEVDEMKEELVRLRDCITTKFSRLNYLLFTVLGALVLNLVMMVLK